MSPGPQPAAGSRGRAGDPRAARGRWLVAAQFALLALLAALGGVPLVGRLVDGGPAGGALAETLGLMLVLAGALLGAWALAANRPGNFRIHPMPHARGRLVDSGPYRWIRHPMYAALLLAGAGAVAGAAAAAPWQLAAAGVAWFVLAGVLSAKAALEEGWLVERFPAYAGYRARTRRFVPGLF